MLAAVSQVRIREAIELDVPLVASLIRELRSTNSWFTRSG